MRRESTATLEFRSFAPQIYNREQIIYIYLDGTKMQTVVLRPDKISEMVVLTELTSSTKIELYSDTCFCPLLTGSADDRVLSFMVGLRS